ncbi:MAG: GntR family transcriptional regulator [Pseudomonadota bacterium]
MKSVIAKKDKKNGRTEDNGRAVDEAYNAIKNMLYYKELSPGQRIVYGDIAGKLNMSLTPVIQALNKLEYSDLVYYKPNKGYFVGQITVKEVREIYQARTALEIAIIPSIIENISKKDLLLIRNSLKEYEISLTSLETNRINMLKDMQFHLKLAEYSHQTVIQKMLTSLLERICLKYRPHEYLGDERINKAKKEHRRIFQAIEMKDEKETIDAIIDHNESSVKFMTGTLNKLKNNYVLNFDS